MWAFDALLACVENRADREVALQDSKHLFNSNDLDMVLPEFGGIVVSHVGAQQVAALAASQLVAVERVGEGTGIVDVGFDEPPGGGRLGARHDDLSLAPGLCRGTRDANPPASADMQRLPARGRDRVKGRWTYLYRAVDSRGQTIDFLLSARRDTVAAKRFFRKALAQPHVVNSRTITVDKYPAYPRAVTEMKRAGELWRPNSHAAMQISQLIAIILFVGSWISTQWSGLSAAISGKGAWGSRPDLKPVSHGRALR
jgi:DDE domain